MKDEDDYIVLTKEERQLADQLDAEILRERVVANVELTPYLRNRLDKEYYKRAKRRLRYEKLKVSNPEALRNQAREKYHRHKDRIRQSQRQYYKNERAEILAQKQGYYRTNRDEILQKRKENYVPHPKEMSDDPIAKYNNEKSQRHYSEHKDEINRRRKAKRQEIMEIWNNMTAKTFRMSNGTECVLYVIKQKDINFSATGIGYRISQVVDMTSTPTSINQTGVTIPFSYVFEEIDITTDIVTDSHFISLNMIRKNHSWFFLEEQEE